MAPVPTTVLLGLATLIVDGQLPTLCTRKHVYKTIVHSSYKLYTYRYTYLHDPGLYLRVKGTARIQVLRKDPTYLQLMLVIYGVSMVVAV